MSNVPSTNFDFLEALGQRINANLTAVVGQLRRAEWLYQAAPELCVMQCRSASEVLARAFQSHMTTPVARMSAFTKSEMFRELAAESRRQHCHASSRAWMDMPNLYRDWSDVVHAVAGATPDTSLRALQSLHQLAAALYRDFCAAPPPQFRTPTALADFATLSRMHAALNASIADRRAFEKLSVQKEAECLELRRQEATLATRHAQVITEVEDLRARLAFVKDSHSNTSSALAAARADVDRINRELTESHHQGEKAAAELKALRREHLELQNQRVAGDNSKRITELLQRSEQRVGAFESQVALLVSERADKEAQLAVVRKHSTALEEAVQDLQAGIHRLRQDSIDAQTELTRLEAYRVSYPDSAADVPAFLHALLFAQPEPLPPFQQLRNVAALPGDPYFERHHASHNNAPCTVRIATRHTDRPIEDLIDAWRIERSNLGYIGNLHHRRGIARALLIAAPDRPGFSVFARPNAPLLSAFGRGAQRLGLRRGARFTFSLIQEIEACWDAGLVTSWPDIVSVAVQGEHPIMLDPVASHFGDLGPPRYVERRSSDARHLSEYEMATSLAFVAASAFFRVVGLLPPGDRLTAELRPRSAADHLLELRRVETQAVDYSATERLAALMAAATQVDAARPPNLSELKNALDSVGRPDGE